ncbi:phospholipase D/transphosphatidylase [Acidisphaera rubrifaciens HS-AP3]|uniref:Phospholipase D n=2 Tax=Acidisphaera TaxID=50714 RepID=A0A0D6P5T5_9PROT|nr:phospholipase D/transphosphatidylase [Acidisphaera rubrifaciens HS-AP3]
MLGVSSCATAPTLPVNPSLLTAEADANPDHALALMKQEGERLARNPFVPGNHATLLINGPASFQALQAAIETAKSRIDMESYEFDDTAGAQFAELLLAARRRGVEVNLIHDAWGTLNTSQSLFDRLRAGGVRVLEYNPLTPNSRVPVDLNDRDHRKLLCVDGRLAITGGVNVSRVYENRPSGHVPSDPDDDAWRDTDVRIIGPVVRQFEHYFMDTWRGQKGPPIPEPPAPPPPFPDGYLIQAIDGSPQDGKPLIYRDLMVVIALAQHSIHLTTGFFAPTPEFMHALERAARRGVDVQLILPSRSTSELALAAGRAKYGDLLEAGIKLHEFQGRVLHAKTAVIDGVWSAVGSSNLDWRSTVWNNEIDAIILGHAFGNQMEAVFAADSAASRTITLSTWEDRGARERLRELGAKLIERLL